MERKHNICVKAAHIETGKNNFCDWAGGSVQGWRENQEDEHICETDIAEDVNLFAVFDGHGGDCVSKFCKAHFQKELLANENFKKGDYKAALHDTCLKMDELLWTPEGLQEIYDTNWSDQAKRDEQAKKESDGIFLEKPDWDHLLDQNTDKMEMVKRRPDAGCTANICLFHKNTLYVANVGDSRTNTVEDNVAKPLSEDHKPSLEREQKRVSAAGGMIYQGRVNMKLSLTRAIGDLNFKQNYDAKPEDQILIAVPDITVHEIQKANNKFVVMGCDGIWENEDADSKNVNQVKWNHEKMPLKQIIEEKIFDKLLAKKNTANEGTDNMTCIIIKFL